MDILDIMAQICTIGRLVAFDYKPDEDGFWVILVNLHESDNNGNWYYLGVVDESDNSYQIVHSCTKWEEAAEMFAFWTNR